MFTIPRGVPEMNWRCWRARVIRGKLMALVSCPACGHKITISGQIDDDGEIRTLLTCPLNSCKFAERVKLIDWWKSLDDFRKGYELPEPPQS